MQGLPVMPEARRKKHKSTPSWRGDQADLGRSVLRPYTDLRQMRRLFVAHHADSCEKVGMAFFIECGDCAGPSSGVTFFGGFQSGVEFVDAFRAVRNDDDEGCADGLRMNGFGVDRVGVQRSVGYEFVEQRNHRRLHYFSVRV